MKRQLHRWLLVISLSSTLATKDVDLPLCPSNLQYFPQNLPMHCKMPGNSENRQFPDLPQYPTLPPMPPSFYQSPSPDKQPNPIPIPIPPFPGMPMPGPMGPPMPGMPPMPGPMPMPIPMVGGPPHKLPVIVMPFYSPDNSFKKPPNTHRKPKPKPPRKKKRPSYDSDTDASSDETSSDYGTSDSDDSDEHGWWKGRRKGRRKMSRRSNKHHKMKKKNKNKKKDFLTPILQYVTKDGYVIFEKKISKNEAKDWLRTKNDAKGEEGKNEIKEFENMQRSIEEPKIETDEQPVKIEEKSIEEFSEPEQTTQKLFMKKHRRKKVNNLINKPGPEP